MFYNYGNDEYMNNDIEFRAGFVAIIGKPNVGKSTLLNSLIGEKLSIVSNKPQTTRRNVRAFYNDKSSQIIFLDTPGFLDPRYELQQKMKNYINDSIKGCEVVLFIADCTDFPTDFDLEVIKILKIYKKRTIYLLNKIDIGDEKKIAELIEDLNTKFDDVLAISALKDKSFFLVLNSIKKYLSLSQPLYPIDDITDMPMRFFAAEIIREKIFKFLNMEIPYCSTVIIEKWIESNNKDVIKANIWVEKDSQKKIIIGKNGAMIKLIRIEAEKDISNLTDKKAVVNLWVKVKPNWRKKPGALSEFGYK
jgi:GTP-binding protein Era